MRLDQFDYPLPLDKIAQRPVQPRDSAKLLIVQSDNVCDQRVSDLPRWLKRGDLLVLNDSAVMAASLKGETESKYKSKYKKEVLLCEPLGQYDWRVMIKGALSERIYFSSSVYADPISSDRVRFNLSIEELRQFIEQAGLMPLPPYISKQRMADEQDRLDYQTVYHRDRTDWGSIAAPTAGLHFTQAVLAALQDKGVELLWLTLHVGAGTFLPVRVDSIAEHKMLAERASLSQEAAQRINETKLSGRRVIAVGTTSLRLLESASNTKGQVSAFAGKTDLFIYPDYRFKVVDGLLTNFHLPKSTPLMLVATMTGLARLKQIYAHALYADYRFFSYGDACLIFL